MVVRDREQLIGDREARASRAGVAQASRRDSTPRLKPVRVADSVCHSSRP